MSDPQLRWFRAWTDLVDDAKLLLLSPGDRWYYVALLALKRSGMLDEDDSDVTRDSKVGIRLRVTDKERDELRRRLVEVRLIDEEWQPHGWDKRQYASDVDRTATERKRRSRLKKRHGTVTRDVPVTVTTLGHGDVTTPESEQSQSRDRTEKEITSPVGSPRFSGTNPRAEDIGLDAEAWKRYVEYRAQIGHRIKPASVLSAQKALAKFGTGQAAVVEQSIANGWQGLFELKSGSVPRRRLRTPEEIDAEESTRAQH